MTRESTGAWWTAGLMTACVAVAGLVAAGCGKRPEDTKRELVILCGSSFVPPTEALIAAFRKAHPDIEVLMTSAGSEDFLPRITLRDQGGILVTHDPYLDYVRDADALADHAQVGFLAPVLAVQPGNPRNITSIEDLAHPGLKVAFSNPQYSTCGEMVEALLKKKGLYDAVMENVGNRLTKGHGNLGTLLETKAVDAVIMWNGVAHTFEESLDIVPTPYEYDTEIRAHVIGLNYAPHQDLVQAFVDFAREEGPRIFREHGYVK